MRWWRTAGFGIAAAGCGSDAASPLDHSLARIQVITSIEGQTVDQAGYILRVDGGSGLTLGVRDTLLLPDITPGEHTLELSGLTPECRVVGLNPRTVTALAAQTTQTFFGLICGTPGTGRLMVSTSTDGTLPDSYLVEVVGGPFAPIGPEDRVTLPSIRAGVDTVTLRVPGGCRVVAPNPRFLRVPDGGEKSTLFKIRCPE